MKYITILGDGMADLPMESLGNKTVLEVANKPNIDSLVPFSRLGMVKTVPDGMKPGSDVANLSALGYNPKTSYTGRSPLEALSIGINMADTDVAFRCNLVTLSNEDNYEDRTMIDYSSGEISTEEARTLIEAIEKELGNDILKFYPGISYRHCLIYKNGRTGYNLTPPHDISDKKITSHLPQDAELKDLMVKSYEILKNHPVNLARISRGENPANSIWLWGEGTKPSLADFSSKNNISGAVISAVDLLKGIGIGANMQVIDVDGATGTLDTNYDGKLNAGIKALLEDGKDYLYLHLEGPDECGHHGDLGGKITAIERIDKLIVGPLIKALKEAGEDFSLLVMPDHPTPISLKTHTSNPVPFMIYNSTKPLNSGLTSYNEVNCISTKDYIENGYTILDELIGK